MQPTAEFFTAKNSSKSETPEQVFVRKILTRAGIDGIVHVEPIRPPAARGVHTTYRVLCLDPQMETIPGSARVMALALYATCFTGVGIHKNWLTLHLPARPPVYWEHPEHHLRAAMYHLLLSIIQQSLPEPVSPSPESEGESVGKASAHQVYTWGYSGKKPAQLLAILDNLGAVLYDIRYSPASRNPAWSRAHLLNLLGSRYNHVPEWGNRNYKGGPIEIVNYPASLKKIQQQLQLTSVVLMCVCADPTRCHRSTVADLLRADGLTVTEYTAPPPDLSDFQPVLF